MEQGSLEWRLARCGSLGASEVHDATHKLAKGGYPAARAQLLVRLTLERFSGRPLDGFTPTPAMLQGLEREPLARAAYSKATGTIVHECGLYPHPELDGTHASPDGLVNAWGGGLLEIKCPQWARHHEIIDGGALQPEHLDQMMWQMSCRPGREWCDFVSFNPDFPGRLQLRIKRIERDDKRIAELTAGVTKFLEELSSRVTKYRELA